MAVEMMRFSKMDDQMAIQEAASAGLKGMDNLIHFLSHHQNNNNSNQTSSSSSSSNNQLDCRELTDFTVAKFKKVISVLNRTGHARFRRGPGQSSSSSPSTSSSLSPATIASPANIPAPVSFVHSQQPQPQTLTLDFTKPNLVSSCSNPKITEAVAAAASASTTQSFSLSATGSSSFMSSITGEGSVSNGKLGSSLFLAPAPAVSAGKPPLSSSHKKRCHEHDQSDIVEKCHCSKRRKSKVKKTIRVPAISTKVADIPADDFSWRKYGQKPIKGSPYPRGYYKCSSVRGCPARKHVERDPDDPKMLIVTYEWEHRHSQSASQAKVVGGVVF